MSGIIFDLDDTLYNERDFVLGGFQAVANCLAPKIKVNSDEIFNKSIQLLDNLGRGKIFNDLLSYYNHQEDISKLVNIYRNSSTPLTLYKDSEFFISKLCTSNHKLGIITDGLNTVQWNKIKLLELEDRFHTIIVTDDYGKKYWKPSPFPYNKMCNEFNLPPAQCVYIGDNANKDFISANKMGMRTVRIKREFGDHKNFIHENSEYNAEYTISTFYELSDILKEMRLI